MYGSGIVIGVVLCVLLTWIAIVLTVQVVKNRDQIVLRAERKTDGITNSKEYTLVP